MDTISTPSPATSGSRRGAHAPRSMPRPARRWCTGSRTSRDVLPRDFCALDGVNSRRPARSRGSSSTRRSCRSSRLRSRSPPLTRQLEISLIGDSALPGGRERDPTAAMLARLNIVEGIFSEQLGPAGSGDRRAPDARGRRSVHRHQGLNAARTARQVPRGNARSARARSRAPGHRQGSRRHHRRHRLRATPCARWKRACR